MSQTAEIFSLVKTLGRPSELPGVWQGLSEVDSPFFCLGPEIEPIVERLRSAFSDQDLLQACVLQQAADQSWQLRPSLLGDYLRLLHPQKSGCQPQLITATEVLPGGQAPYQALLADHLLHKFTQEIAEECSPFYHLAITPTLADTAILWRLGVPAVPLAGLHKLDSAGLAMAKRSLRRLRPRMPEEDESSHLSLVLVNCSLENWQFEDEPDIEPVGQLLRRIHDDLGLEIHTRVWQPSQRAMDQYATALHFQNCDTLRQAILGGFDREAELLVSRTNPCYEPREELPAYTDSLNAWIESNSVDRLTQESILAKLQQRSEQQFILPLIRQAEAHADPMTAALMLGLSHVSRSLEDISIKLCAPLQRGDSRSLQLQSGNKALRAEHLLLTKQQITLCQAITERSRHLARAQDPVQPS